MSSRRFTLADVRLYEAKSLTREGRAATKSSQLEKELHADILAYCRNRGWEVVHSRMDVPATVQCGTPDFVIALEAGRTLWVEAKRGGAKLRPEQRAWLAALRKLGHRAVVVRSFEEFILALKGEEI